MDSLEGWQDTYVVVRNIMIGFAILYLLFEIALNLNDIDEDTSNILLYKASKERLFFIPFALGAIVGHLFLGTDDLRFDIGDLPPVLILFGLAVGTVIVAYKVPFKKTDLFLGVLLFLGILYGHLFWSMNMPR
ncbi:MAG: hypothetical protein AAGB24_06695 [Bacteroidota bacterium]